LKGNPMITGQQIKAARELLGWSREQLASEARMSKTSVGVCERGDPQPSDRLVNAIRGVLESAGVEFTHGDPRRARPREHGARTSDTISLD
jgi:ribosome-binding protein aMBF1 (putative translation factor)